jgi:hypothetical protein
MTTADYILLAFETSALAVLIYVLPGRLLKEGLLLFRAPPVVPASVVGAVARAKETRRLGRRRAAINRWFVRLACVLMGIGVGFLPVWPGWLLFWWGPILGGVAGGLCVPIHAGVEEMIPRLAELLPEVIVGRLGGVQGMMRKAAGGSVTQTIDTLDDTVDSYGDE